MAICVGCGLAIDGDTGLLVVDTGTCIVCDSNGVSLQVAPNSGVVCTGSGISSDIHILDSTSIDLSGDGKNATPLSAAVIKSPTSCNGLQLLGNGVWTPCVNDVSGDSLNQISPQSPDFGVPIPLTDGGTYDFLNSDNPASINICNTSCCAVRGILTVQVGDIYVEALPGFIGNGLLQVSIDGGGFITLFPSTRDTFTNPGSSNAFHDFRFFANLSLGPTAPGVCHTYQWRVRFSVQTAAGSNLRSDTAGPQFFTRWIAVQTGCTCT
jgi:hypothetical protein